MKTLKEYNGWDFNYVDCPECLSNSLSRKGSKKYCGGWVSYYKCNTCDSKYRYTPTDMGQSIPVFDLVDEFEDFTPDKSKHTCEEHKRAFTHTIRRSKSGRSLDKMNKLIGNTKIVVAFIGRDGNLIMPEDEN